ncbi:ornithine cyclodeaminase family protein [Actibacterium sp. 188UL27-1]|uniref:ornithine cyclodeaminase family protein n=1 Tax=Actibacterium sp. 188UL27-1 TaxID=2786961 RepID=UPI00195B693D|nr:ornithine cyclodeaminase [Actibacterium sp. 188UL27-1]MBM7070090.1 ornithine cyclodeaminase [Actibacterium sp. 188UL27-1]
MTIVIPFDEGERCLDWLALIDAFVAGHKLSKAEVADVFLYQGDNTLLNRSAWIKGMGLAVKCATIFPGNAATGQPTIGGAVNLFSDRDGTLEAIVDFHLVTKWKTAGDSLLGARQLARADSRRILIVGAGTVGHSLAAAYGALFPAAEFSIWNRTLAGAQAFAETHPGIWVEPSLPEAVAQADIITCATMSTDPVIRGEWLQPGQHVDLIGAYRPDMREADDDVLRRGRLFVDSRASTIEHIGELKTPIAKEVITPDDVIADYYQLDQMKRQSDDEITVFKNGGGAHLDLMTSRFILDAWKETTPA